MRFAGSSKISDFLMPMPDVVGLETTSMDANSAERQSGIFSEAKVQGAGLNSMEIVKTAAHQARGIEASGMAQAAATRASGMSGMISGIAGGIGSLNFSGGGGGGSSGWTPSFDASTPRFG